MTKSDRPRPQDDSAAPKTPESAAGTPWRDERTLRVEVSPDRLWRAFTDPEILTGWFPDEARGTVEPGGELVHVWRDFGFEMAHEAVEVEPGRRVVFRAIGPGGAPFLQEIVIERDGAASVLRLIHSGFSKGADWDGDVDATDSGWQLALALLRHYLENYFARPRDTFQHFVPVPVEVTDVAPWFRESVHLWLGPADPAPTGGVGDAVRVDLGDGHTLEGQILAWSGTELELSWREIEGVLELKAFPGPGATMVGVRVAAWGGHDLSAQKALLVAAVDRLGAELAPT